MMVFCYDVYDMSMWSRLQVKGHMTVLFEITLIWMEFLYIYFVEMESVDDLLVKNYIFIHLTVDM